MLKFSLIRQCFQMSIRNIQGNKLRSFLTMLGIIIGVGAVIGLITVVSGVADYMIGQFSSMGAGSLSVSIFGTPMKQGLSETNLQEIAEIENIQSVSPSVSVTTTVVSGNHVSEKVTVNGRSEQFFVHQPDMIRLGRPLRISDMEGTINVCVIDGTAAKALLPGETPLGAILKIGGVQYKVVGVAGKTEDISAAFSSSGEEGTIYIPYRNALRMNNTNTISSIDVYVGDTAKMNETVEALTKLLENVFNQAENAYFIINVESLLDAMNTMTGMMTAMLAGIASIALLVGGIGIMNMMLVSVTERNEEIGLRKALGAEPGVIQLQFLMESVILSVIGGAIGILFGETIAYIASVLIKYDFSLNINAILIGFFFSLAVGVIFGWAPARRASRLNPIDALRSE